MTSGKSLLRISALLLLCPLLLLTGCATPQKPPVQYRAVRLPRLSLPADLTGPVDVPQLPAHLTWGDSVRLNAALYGLLGRCNADRAAVRKIGAGQKQL